VQLQEAQHGQRLNHIAERTGFEDEDFQDDNGPMTDGPATYPQRRRRFVIRRSSCYLP